MGPPVKRPPLLIEAASNHSPDEGSFPGLLLFGGFHLYLFGQPPLIPEGGRLIFDLNCTFSWNLLLGGVLSFLMTIEPSSAYKRVIYWLFQVLPTKKPGYFLLTWSDYGLELKRRFEENLARQQGQRGASAAPEGPVPIFRRLVDFTEEIEHEGEKIQVISPHKIRLQQLKNPPSSIQGNAGKIHHGLMKNTILVWLKNVKWSLSN